MESTGPARDPETGKFVARSQPEETDGEEETSEPQILSEDPEDAEEDGLEADTDSQEEEDGDLEFELEPEVLSILEKYDGDLNKALRALNESQSMIGRQGNELGDLRQQLTELAGLIQQNQVNPLAYAPYRNSLDEDPSALVMEVLDRTAQTGQFDQATYEAAIAAWGEEDPFGAARLDAQVAFARQQAAAMAQEPSPADRSPARSEPSLEEAMSAVVQRHPNIEQHIALVGEIAKEFPTLRTSMANGTPSQKAQAFEELVMIAESRNNSATSREAIKRVVLRTQEEVRKEKADAAVISAKNRSAASAEPQGLDLFFREFDRATGQLHEDE